MGAYLVSAEEDAFVPASVENECDGAHCGVDGRGCEEETCLGSSWLCECWKDVSLRYREFQEWCGNDEERRGGRIFIGVF